MVSKGTEKTFGQRLKELRKERNWTQGRLAQRSGLTRPHISKLERDRIGSTGVGTILKLADAFQVDVEELSRGTNIPSLDFSDPELQLYLRKLAELPPEDRKLVMEFSMPYIEEQRRKQQRRQQD